jgi:hypothetical protein
MGAGFWPDAGWDKTAVNKNTAKILKNFLL